MRKVVLYIKVVALSRAGGADAGRQLPAGLLKQDIGGDSNPYVQYSDYGKKCKWNDSTAQIFVCRSSSRMVFSVSQIITRVDQ